MTAAMGATGHQSQQLIMALEIAPPRATGSYPCNRLMPRDDLDAASPDIPALRLHPPKEPAGLYPTRRTGSARPLVRPCAHALPRSQCCLPCRERLHNRRGVAIRLPSDDRQADVGAALPHRLAMSTARIPMTNMPSKVPAPPIEATGAPSPPTLSRLRRSAPISVPRLPPT
jgi:hypothetical protein